MLKLNGFFLFFIFYLLRFLGLGEGKGDKKRMYYSWSKTRWTQLSSTEASKLKHNRNICLLGTIITEKKKTFNIYQDIRVLPTAKCVTNLHKMFNRFVVYRPVYVESLDGTCPPTSRDDRVPRSPSLQARRRAEVMLQFQQALGSSNPAAAVGPSTDSMVPRTMSPNAASSVSSLTSLVTTAKRVCRGSQLTKPVSSCGVSNPRFTTRLRTSSGSCGLGPNPSSSRSGTICSGFYSLDSVAAPGGDAPARRASKQCSEACALNGDEDDSGEGGVEPVAEQNGVCSLKEKTLAPTPSVSLVSVSTQLTSVGHSVDTEGSFTDEEVSMDGEEACPLRSSSV